MSNQVVSGSAKSLIYIAPQISVLSTWVLVSAVVPKYHQRRYIALCLSMSAFWAQTDVAYYE